MMGGALTKTMIRKILTYPNNVSLVVPFCLTMTIAVATGWPGL